MKKIYVVLMVLCGVMLMTDVQAARRGPDGRFAAAGVQQTAPVPEQVAAVGMQKRIIGCLGTFARGVGKTASWWWTPKWPGGTEIGMRVRWVTRGVALALLWKLGHDWLPDIPT